MTDLAGLPLLRPLWLAVLVPALVLAALAVRRADGGAIWRRVIDPALMPALRQMGFLQDGGRDLRPWLLGLAAGLLALGLAGPAVRNPDAPAFRNVGTLMILLDLSPSMTEGGGLDDAQAAVSRLLDTGRGRPTALVVYAGESFLVSVPTEETESLQTVVAVIDDTTMPLAGSRPELALAEARSVLRNAAAESAQVVLVSDGGGLGPEAVSEARLLASDGVSVSGVFVDAVDPPYGMPLPNRHALQDLVDAAGGVLAPADDLSGLERHLSRAAGGGTAAGAARRAVLYEDRGRWLVALALLPLLPAFRRRRG